MASYSGLDISANLGIHILQNPADPKNPLTWQEVLGIGKALGSFLPGFKDLSDLPLIYTQGTLLMVDRLGFLIGGLVAQISLGPQEVLSSLQAIFFVFANSRRSSTYIKRVRFAYWLLYSLRSS